MANRYWVGGDALWNATVGTKWATTSGGAGGSAVPTSSDDVFFDNGAGTGNCTLDSGYAASAKSVTCTGYIKILASSDGTGTLTVAGAVTFVAGMTLSCTNTLQCNTTATLTSGGKTWGGAMKLRGTSQTYTLGDSWIVTGLLTIDGTTLVTVNSNTIHSGGLTSSVTNVAGTTTFDITGGTWSDSMPSGSGWKVPITLSGNVTVSGSIHMAGTSSITWVSGTITTTGSTLIWNSSGTLTMNTGNNMTWGNLNTQSGTITLSADLYYSGTWTISNTTTVNTNNVYYTGTTGGVTGAQTLAGSTTLNFNGTGTWTNTTIQCNLTFTAGSVMTLSATVAYNTGTMTINETIIASSTTLTITTANTTITNNVSGTTFSAITLGMAGGSTTHTFNGTFGITIGTLTMTTATASNSVTLTLNLLFGNTYVVTTNFTTTLTGNTPQSNRHRIISSSGGNRVIFTLSQGAAQSLDRCNATDVDSSGGKTIESFKTTLSNTLNWETMTDRKTVASVYCS